MERDADVEMPKECAIGEEVESQLEDFGVFHRLRAVLEATDEGKID